MASCFLPPSPLIRPNHRPNHPLSPLHPSPKHRSSPHPRPHILPATLPTAQAPLHLTDENVRLALSEARQTLGSVFGVTSDNRAVGITGDVELVELDGPVVILRLTGRFWHKRAQVLARVSAFLKQRIPEICDTQIEDVLQLRDSEDESHRLSPK